MHSEESSVQLTTKALISRLFILVWRKFSRWRRRCQNGFCPRSAIACAVFLGIILGTLFFWNFRPCDRIYRSFGADSYKFHEHHDFCGVFGS